MSQLSGKKIISPSRRGWSIRRGWANVRALQERQRKYILGEWSIARGLIPILMKHHYGGKWSKEEREILQRDLRALSNLKPYLIPLLIPGGVFMLPFIAWWMDHRRKGRKKQRP